MPFPAICRAWADTCVDRHRSWGHLPPRLVEQIPDYILSVSDLIDDTKPPMLIHGDVTEDHVLLVPYAGSLATPYAAPAGAWQITGLIDMGDARVADLLYELVPLYMGALGADKQLLDAFLTDYVEMRVPRFVHRAMTYTLLFEFDVLCVPDQDALRRSTSLETLASALWDTTQPPL